MNKTHYVAGNELILDSYTSYSKPMRYERVAILPTKDWDNAPIYVLDWKADETSVRLTYQTRRDLYAPVHDDVFPCRVDEIKLKPPGRNWEWSEFWGVWRNKKTNEKIRP